MNTQNIRHNAAQGFSKAFNVHYLKSSIYVNQSDGCCICPICSHLIFDELLTGVCPNCHRRFAPALPFNKSKDRKDH